LTVKFTMFGVRFLDLDFIGVKRCFSTSSDQVISFEQSIPMEKLPARPTEDRRRDRAEGAKAACEGYRHLEGGKVPRHRDWHGAAHLRRASNEPARGGAMSKGEQQP